MYDFVVPEILSTLCLHDVFGYVQADFAIDHTSFEAVKFCLAFHNPDFVAKKSCFARGGMRHQRFFC